MLIQFIGFQNATIWQSVGHDPWYLVLPHGGHKPLELATETPRFAMIYHDYARESGAFRVCIDHLLPQIMDGVTNKRGDDNY